MGRELKDMQVFAKAEEEKGKGKGKELMLLYGYSAILNCYRSKHNEKCKHIERINQKLL